MPLCIVVDLTTSRVPEYLHPLYQGSSWTFPHLSGSILNMNPIENNSGEILASHSPMVVNICIRGGGGGILCCV